METPMSKHTRWSRLCFSILDPLFSILASILLLLLVAGCNYMGAFGAKILPPPPIPAAYVPTTEPMVVIAENYRNPSGSAMDGEQVARYVHDDLLTHHVAEMIDPIKVIDLKSKQPTDFRSLSISQIGKLVGAKQVLYINVVECTLVGAMGTDAVKGQCSARVKIVDVETGFARWPIDEAAGYLINVKTAYSTTLNASDEAALRLTLQQQAAGEISRLFYAAPAEDFASSGNVTH